MDHRPTSPSAHFYTHRGSLNAVQVDQPSEQVPGICGSPLLYTEPFNKFRDFSSYTTHECRHPQYGYHIPEEMISPCMPIPNPFPQYRPGPQVQELFNGSDTVSIMHRYPFRQHVSNATSPRDMGPHKPVIECQSLPPHPSQPPIYAGPQQLGSAQYPVTSSCPANGYSGEPGVSSTRFTHKRPLIVQVPSVSDLSTIPGPHNSDNNTGAIAEDIDGHEAISVMASSRDDITATIYSDDEESINTGSPPNTAPPTTNITGNFTSSPERDLVGDVASIHDICLLATQGYLQGLRRNWKLRNGREVSGQRPIRMKHNLEYHTLSMGSSPYDGDCDYDDDEDRVRYSSRGDEVRKMKKTNKNKKYKKKNKNPIPRPSNSLLHNIHHICGLIWRRSRRDREDVLGAEARGYRDMSLLHECGETVVVLCNPVGLEGYDPSGCFTKVLEAGRNICRELGDWDALGRMGDMDIGRKKPGRRT